MNHRSGFSLIEIVISLAITSFLLVIGTSMIKHAMDHSKEGEKRLNADRAATQLLAQLRSDVHGAKDAKINDGAGLELILPNQNWIRYTVQNSKSKRWASEVLREESKNGEKGVERFHFPEGYELAFETAENPSRVIATLMHTPLLRVEPPEANAAKPSPKIVRVERQGIAILDLQSKSEAIGGTHHD